MLYSDLVTDLDFYAYKLILESMLMDKGWYFDVKSSDNARLVDENCFEYATFRRSSILYDTELARSAVKALMDSSPAQVEQICGLSSQSHSITILKHFIMRCPEIKNARGMTATEAEVNALMEDYTSWIGRIYNTDTLRSICASNPRIRFYLVRTFLTNKQHNNRQLVNENPHILDYLYDAFLLDCKQHESMMEDSDDRPGHEGINNLQLIGTLCFSMNNFISAWAGKELSKAIHKNTVRGTGDESYDQLDLKYSQETESRDVNLTKILSDIASVNACWFKDKNQLNPFYSVLSWYQTIYLGEQLLVLKRQMDKFFKGQYTQIPQQSIRYQFDSTLEERLAEIPFNMSRTTTIKGSTKITGSGNVIFAPSFGTDRYGSNSETTAHFIKKFKEVLQSLNHIYTNRDNITLSNLYLEVGKTDTTEKTNYQFNEERMRTKAPDEARILHEFQQRFELDIVPTNKALHSIAMLIYGVNAVIDLAEFLRQEGLTIMDAPCEADMYNGVPKFISNVDSLLLVRNMTAWKFSDKYNIPVDSGMIEIQLLTDQELANIASSALSATEDYSSIELPTGSNVSLVNPNNNTILINDNAQKIIRHQQGVMHTRLDEPIYSANSVGREKYITPHQVRTDSEVSLKPTALTPSVTDINFSKDLRRARIQLCMLLAELFPPHTQLELMNTKEQTLFTLYTKVIEDIRKHGQNADPASLSRVKNLTSKITQSVYTRCRDTLRAIQGLPMYNRSSLFSGSYAGTPPEFATDRVLRQIKTLPELYFKIGAIVWMAHDHNQHTQELDALLEGIDLSKYTAEFNKCSIRAAKLAMELKTSDFINLSVESLADGTLKNLYLHTNGGATVATNSLDQAVIQHLPTILNTAMNNIISVQSILSEVGQTILRENPNLILLVGNRVVDVQTENVYFAKARKLSSLLPQYKTLLTMQGEATTFEEIIPGVTCTSDSRKRYTAPNDESSVYKVSRSGMILVDGKRWLDPYKRQDRVKLIKRSPADKVACRFIQLTTDPNASMSSTFEFTEGNDISAMLSLGTMTALGVEKAKRVIDIYAVLHELLSDQVIGTVQQMLSKSPKLKLTAVSQLRDLPSASCSIVVLSSCMVYQSELIQKYENLLQVFREYNGICALKRDGKITVQNFEKNAIVLATYSDIYQIMMIKAERDVQEMLEYLTQATSLRECLSKKSFINTSGILRSMRINYVMPIDNNYEAYARICQMLCAYISEVFKPQIHLNIQRMQSAIKDMRANMTELFQLRTVSLTQIQYNLSKFNRCRDVYHKTRSSSEYRDKLLQQEAEDLTLRRFKERFKTDPDTGVFFDPDKQQYFFNSSSDSPNVEDLDTLVNVDGICLRYTIHADGTEGFSFTRLSKLSTESLNRILRK